MLEGKPDDPSRGFARASKWPGRVNFWRVVAAGTGGQARAGTLGFREVRGSPKSRPTNEQRFAVPGHTTCKYGPDFAASEVLHLARLSQDRVRFVRDKAVNIDLDAMDN